MLRTIQLKNNDLGTEVSWPSFTSSISYLMPKTLPEKMQLFLRAIAPIDLTESQFPHYEFSQDDIIELCRNALNIIKDSNDFYEEMSINFAKYIY